MILYGSGKEKLKLKLPHEKGSAKAQPFEGIVNVLHCFRSQGNTVVVIKHTAETREGRSWRSGRRRRLRSTGGRIRGGFWGRYWRAAGRVSARACLARLKPGGS